MKQHCANCGSGKIEIGEGGAPSRCAKCGCTSFVNVRNEKEFAVLTQQGSRPELRIITHKECPPEKARALFAKIHEVIDAAK